MNHLRTMHTASTVIISEETGEEIDVQTSSSKILIKDRESFIQLYTAIESKLMEISWASERLFNYCLLHCDRENVIKINKYDKQILKEKWGLANSTVSNSLAQLKEKKMIVPFKDIKGVFRINPNYVWKSDSNSRTQTLKYFLEVECPDCNK